MTTTPTNIKKHLKDRDKMPEMPAKEAFQQVTLSIYRSVGVKNGTPPKKYANAWEFFQRCSDPGNEALVTLTEELRELKQKDPEAYKAQRRKRCPAFALGKWASRGSLAEPSRLLGFDIDGGGEDTHVFNLENAAKSPFIARMEQSLGGGGRIWAFAEFPQERRAEAYQGLCEHFSEVFALPIKNGEEEAGEHIDPATGDITRLWFPAYTPPNLVYQPDTFQIFHLPEGERKPEEKGHRGGDQPPPGNGKYLHEFTTEEKVNDICRQISERGIDVTKGVETWFAKVLLPLAHEYGEGGRHLAHLVSQFHRDYRAQDTDREFSRALSKERGAVTIGTFLEHARQQGITFDAQSIIASRRAAQDGKPASQPAPAAHGEAPREEKPEEQEPEEFFQFYSIKKDGEKREVKINFLRLVELLKKLGFRRYDKDGEFFIVKVTDNVVKECSTEEVIDAFENYILDFPGEELPEGVTKDLLRNKIYGSISTYFSKNIMGRLRPEKPIIFNEHTREKAFFFYRNGYVEVTSQGVELKPYSTLNNCIWENQMIERDFKPLPGHKYNDLSFVQFVRNVSNGWKKHPLSGRENDKSDPARFEAFQTIVGYLLHAFFDTDLKAVIFTDSRIDEEGEANGRSGKTLLLKALGYVLNREFKKSTTYVELNGKDLKSDSQFKYQELGLDTRLLHLNDVKRNFKFEELFNDVTEGIKRERKNEAPSIVWTKIAISTNRTIKIKGASAKGRSIEVELSEYYDENWTPRREFGEWFFSDWTPDQWAQFDAFLMDCVKAYFRKGLIRPETINLEERKKIEETSPEFVQWMEDQDKFFSDGSEHDKKGLYEHFRSRYPDFDWLKQRKFTEWLRTYCLYDESYHPIDGEKDERRSNGQNLITFRRKEATGGEETPF